MGENSAIENLLENLIASALSGENVPQIILSDTLSLIFRYLEMYPETLVGSTPHGSHGENEKAAITDYIQTNYRTASLTELSERLGMTPQYVSKLTVRLFGATFSGLVREKRFSEAELLLLTSDMPVTRIAEEIGYENNSFFHKRFREQYGVTPAKWKRDNRIKQKRGC